MDLVKQEKIESSILNGLGYIVRLEKKNGNNRFKVLALKKAVNVHSRPFSYSAINRKEIGIKCKQI